jgi:branched-chain amino acid transport system substrate-binding protein
MQVGAALSLTGRFAVQGEQARRGLLLWTEHVNHAGGLIVESGTTPRQVRLLVYDDVSTRAGAASATERLIVEDRVDLLFGPYSSVLALAAARVSELYGRVLWNHGGSSDALDAAGFRRVVSFLTPASRYFAPVLDLAARSPELGGRAAERVALLYGAAGTFPASVAAGAREHAGRLGMRIVLDAPYSASDLSEQVAAVARLRPDLILGVGTTEADLTFARELRRRRVQAPLVALVAAPIEHFRRELGADADGFIGPSQWEPLQGDRPEIGPTSAAWVAAFRERFGAEPDYPAAQAYAAGLIAAHCVERAGSSDDEALRAAAGGLDTSTFYGRFRLDPGSGRQVGHEMVVIQWQAGQKQLVWPPAAATARLQPQVPAAAPTTRPSDATPSS